MFLRLACGILLSLGIAVPAGLLGSLSLDGVLGAILVGTLTLGLGGWPWGLALVAFFISSSLLTRWRREGKLPLADLQAKGGRRDLGQVLANGGLGALLAVLSALFPHPLWPAACHLRGLQTRTCPWAGFRGDPTNRPSRPRRPGRR